MKKKIHKVHLEGYVLYGISKFPEMVKEYQLKKQYFSSPERQLYFQQLTEMIGKFEFGPVDHNIAYISRTAGCSDSLISDIERYPVANEAQVKECILQLLDKLKLEKAVNQFTDLIDSCQDRERSWATFVSKLPRFVDISIEETNSIETAEAKDYFSILEKGLSRKEDHIVNGRPLALSTGFPVLDSFFGGGLKPGELYVFVGGGGTGKSAHANQIAQNIVKTDSNSTIVYFQAEMTEDQVGELGAHSLMGLSMRDLPGIQDIERARKELQSKKYLKRIHYFDKSSLNRDYIRGVLTSEIRRFPISAAFVDHPGFWREDNWVSSIGNEMAERTFAIKELKQVAKDFKIPVITLAHTNREIDKLKPGQRPTMAMIAWSSEWEKVADSVLCLRRDQKTGYNTLYNLKGRMGGTLASDEVNYKFDPKTQTIVELPMVMPTYK